VESIGALVEAGAGVDLASAVGLTALMHAASLGRVDSLAILITHGATVNLESATGRTALMAALRNPKEEAAALTLDALVARGAMVHGPADASLFSDATVANRNRVGFRVMGDRSRGRFATPADCP
jgi:ankyrin repeat protein